VQQAQQISKSPNPKSNIRHFLTFRDMENRSFLKTIIVRLKIFKFDEALYWQEFCPLSFGEGWGQPTQA